MVKWHGTMAHTILWWVGRLHSILIYGVGVYLGSMYGSIRVDNL